MRDVLLIARIELRRRLRNRSALFTAFIGPLVLALVFGLLISGASNFSLKIGIADNDDSAITSGFVTGLLGVTDSPVTFVKVTDPRAAVDGDDVDAALVLPAGFGAAVSAGRAATVQVLRDPTREVSGEVARSIAVQFAAGIGSRQLAAVTAAQLGQPVAVEQLADFSDSFTAALVDVAPGGREVNAVTSYGASMSILFLFFTVAFAARSLIAERRSGIVARMLATSTPVRPVAAGKVLAVSALGLAGFVTVWLVTQLIFGANWGNPLAVLVTIAATVFAIAGVATFICGFARTEQQADGYTSMVAFVLALLGGNFVGPGQAPDALRRLARFTPNGQAINALARISVDGVGLSSVLPGVGALVAFGAVFGGVGLAVITRTLRT